MKIINGRYFKNTPMGGNVQGYAHALGSPGVTLGWCVGRADDVSYTSGSISLSPSDARAIAAALVEAADYSEAPTATERVDISEAA